MNVKTIFVIFSIGCATVGCKPGVGNDNNMPQKQEEKVLVKVGERTYTTSDLSAEIDFRLKYYKYMNPEAKNEDGAMIRLHAVETLVPAFIQNALVLSVYENVAATNQYLSEVEQAVRSKHEDMYVKAKEGSKNFTSLSSDIEKLGVGAVFHKLFDAEVKTETLITGVYTNAYAIDDAGLAILRRDIAEANKLASATNAAIDILKTNIVAAIRRGEDFNAMYNKYDMTPPEFAEDAEYQWTEGDFKDMPGLWEQLTAMAPGEVTDAVDATDSWHIYRVEKHIPASASETGEEALLLTRLYLRKAALIDEYSDDEIREMMEPGRRQKIVEMIMRQALESVDITFPSGMEEIKSEALTKMEEFVRKTKEGSE